MAVHLQMHVNQINDQYVNHRYVNYIYIYAKLQAGYGTTRTGYGTAQVGCRGGSRYVEECWGFPYLKVKKFKVVVFFWFYGLMVL